MWVFSSFFHILWIFWIWIRLSKYFFLLFHVACDCGGDELDRYSGNCAPESGKCECKEAFRGAEDCSACAEGYHSYPECAPCECFPEGTVKTESGLPVCTAEGSLQCPCLENYNGTFCDECADEYYGFPDCQGKFECEICEIL